MNKEVTDQEKKKVVDQHLTEIYGQLQINCKKTLGAAYDKHGGDLLGLALTFFLEKPLDVQYQSVIDGKCENFITFIMGFQSKSGTSKWFSQYRRFHESQREYYTDHYQYDVEKEDKYEDDDMMLCIKESIKTLTPYEKMLIEAKVIKGMRFTEISETYEIPYSSLASELKKTLNKLKKKCQHLQYLA